MQKKFIEETVRHDSINKADFATRKTPSGIAPAPIEPYCHYFSFCQVSFCRLQRAFSRNCQANRILLLKM
jgi:hypothetical protein